ncbi:Hypothetical predicted protein [Cloeon dipterum]|uniref:FZ domain-containing protein n=1 Tax=Cloeon dipterum TaxID=197152 RepID=A0A8S1C9A2_9INSE|nr:Hypothetical predicted protein [Cloeon dipterum]
MWRFKLLAVLTLTLQIEHTVLPSCFAKCALKMDKLLNVFWQTEHVVRPLCMAMCVQHDRLCEKMRLHTEQMNLPWDEMILPDDAGADSYPPDKRKCTSGPSENTKKRLRLALFRFLSLCVRLITEKVWMQ